MCPRSWRGYAWGRGLLWVIHVSGLKQVRVGESCSHKNFLCHLKPLWFNIQQNLPQEENAEECLSSLDFLLLIKVLLCLLEAGVRADFLSPQHTGAALCSDVWDSNGIRRDAGHSRLIICIGPVTETNWHLSMARVVCWSVRESLCRWWAISISCTFRRWTIIACGRPQFQSGATERREKENLLRQRW